MSLTTTVIKKMDYVYLFQLDGSIDADSYQDLETELNEAMDDKTKAIILDMDKVIYISSIGIRVIITAKKLLEGKHASFSMVNLQPQIKKVFDVMKILPMFDIFDDMPEADKYIDQIIKDEIKKTGK